MNRFIALLLVGFWGAMPVVAVPVVEEDFEGDLSGWIVGSHLPEDPNNPGREVAVEASVSGEKSYSGSKALRLYIDGRQDDGTLWIMRPVPVPTNQATEVELSFRFWSPFKDTFNNLADVVAYVGAATPQKEEDFERLAPVTEVGEWDLMSAKILIEPGQADTVWVAAGFSVVWESEQTYFVDELKVEARPAGATAVRSSSWAEIKQWSEREE